MKTDNLNKGFLEADRRIKSLAQKIWEKKGKPAGSAKDDWNEAERIIRGK